MKVEANNNITILGTGAWGSALANVLSKNHHNITMWGIDEKEIEDVNKGFNSKYFGETNFVNARNITATKDLNKAIQDANYIMIAVPSSAIVSVLNQVKNILPKNKKVNIINVSKGIEAKTKKFFSDIIKDEMKGYLNNYCTLIGPSFAVEVFNNRVTMINIVGPNKSYLEEVSSLFNNDTFRLVVTKNEKGAELFAALKNVLALGIGIVNHFYPYANTIAAALSIGVKEIAYIYETVFKSENSNKDNIGFQLAGIGDIFLTCSSTKSRNFSFGLEVGQKGFKKAFEENCKTVEGYYAAKILQEIIEKNNLIEKTPFLYSIIQILYLNKDSNLILDFTKNYY